MALPIPLPPPVTIATLSVRSGVKPIVHTSNSRSLFDHSGVRFPRSHTPYTSRVRLVTACPSVKNSVNRCVLRTRLLYPGAATTEMLPVSLPSRIIPPPPAIPVRRHVIQAVRNLLQNHLVERRGNLSRDFHRHKESVIGDEKVPQDISRLLILDCTTVQGFLTRTFLPPARGRARSVHFPTSQDMCPALAQTPMKRSLPIRTTD